MKEKFPRADAIAVAGEMVKLLRPCTSRFIVAGSLRRRKSEVSDVELVFIPNVVKGPDPADLFGKEIEHDAVCVALEILLTKGLIEKRPNVNGSETWGPQIKLARHKASGIPIDLFAAKPESWWNILVCRTGSTASNIAICQAAELGGWKWRPFLDGFTRPNPERNGWLLGKPMHSEQEVFEFVGLQYREPWERDEKPLPIL